MSPSVCPTCGSPVRVVSADEGTSHFEPDGIDPTELVNVTMERNMFRDALVECYGSYGSLVANLKGRDIDLQSDLMQWDGPICARRALGIEDPR